MSAKTTSALILLGTLILGVVMGVVLSGTLAQQRRDQVERLRGPGGFVEHMERVIEPRDEAQRSVLRPVLEATDLRNRGLIDAAEADILVELQEMAQQLDTLLDEEQRARLAREIVRARPLGAPPGGPPGGPPQGGPPPGGPPPGGGPPPR